MRVPSCTGTKDALLPRSAAVPVRHHRAGDLEGRGRRRGRRASWSEKPFGNDLTQRARSSTCTMHAITSRRRRSTGWTTGWASTSVETTFLHTLCEQHPGAAAQPRPTCTAFRSPWPRSSTSPIAAGSTTGPVPPGTWCKTTCSRCWPRSWPTCRPAVAPGRLAQRQVRRVQRPAADHRRRTPSAASTRAIPDVEGSRPRPTTETLRRGPRLAADTGAGRTSPILIRAGQVHASHGDRGRARFRRPPHNVFGVRFRSRAQHALRFRFVAGDVDLLDASVGKRPGAGL